jgi:uncharacterized membrane protein YeaQ/YmgE (transglycosylase-associated protein family)
MGILSWLLLGLVVGALARWIMPGADPGGILVTILIGIAGALIGGLASASIGLGSATDFNFAGVLLALVGSLLLLGGYRRLRG